MPMIKQVPGRRTPGYYQINPNQLDSPFGDEKLIKEADAFDRSDSRRESQRIASPETCDRVLDARHSIAGDLDPFIIN